MRRDCPPIIVADYDPLWAESFEAEKDNILSVVGRLVVAIEHIGSTAVVGLAAKPIVDIMCGVRSLSDADKAIDALESIEYEYVPAYESRMPERRFFRKPAGQPRRFNLHVVPFDSPFWVRHLLFRDWLRDHPEDRRCYASLKRSLAAQCGSDVDQYTDAKTEFITNIEAEARRATER